MLKRGGIDASYSSPPTLAPATTAAITRVTSSATAAACAICTTRWLSIQSASLAVPGGLQNLSKWKNAAYDKIVDEFAVADTNDKAKLLGLFKSAMEIWLPELPDVQLTEFHHRSPLNQTYWKGFPTQENSYCNPTFWHLTYGTSCRSWIRLSSPHHPLQRERVVWKRHAC
jgi:peptide/nickel transport system substrate-binding protein